MKLDFAFMRFLILAGIILSTHISFGQIKDLILSEEEIVVSRERVKIEATAIFSLLTNKSKNTDNSIVRLPVHGQQIAFHIKENLVLDAAFRSKYPEIMTFDLQSIDNPGLSGSLTAYSDGLFVTIFGEKEMISIYPEGNNYDDFYIIEYGIQHDVPKPKQFCGHDHSNELTDDIKIGKKETHASQMLDIGSKIFTYRVAVVATGEFYRANGNDDIAVLAVITHTLNVLNNIYSNEMSIRFQSGSLIHLFNNPATDPFMPDELQGASPRTIQAGNVIQSLFNPTSFDIGHVFHTHVDGDGWSNGGIAALRSVCNNFSAPGQPIVKARGWSGSFSNIGNAWVNLVAHEFGHQFGANHTFNGTGESCTGNISPTHAFEIASGTTIMSYWGACSNEQNIPTSGEADNYFHAKSIEQIYNYVYNDQGGSCGNSVNSENALPSVVANPCNAIYNIPLNTPFYLTARGVDANNDLITYCWEQIDEDGPGTPTQGLIGAAAASSATAPLFRSYPPVTSPTRFFPSLLTLTSGTQNPFEVLPVVARKIKMNVAVRDNHTEGGAQSQDAVEINVSNSGPLIITRPVTGTILNAGNQELFTWNVNGSGALCNRVRIKLSINGGLTFPIILAEGVNYASGSTTISIPPNLPAVTNAKVMIECMDYDCFAFFALSQNYHTINSSCMARPGFVCPTTKVVADMGSSALNLTDMSKISGSIVTSVSKTITASMPQARIASWNQTRTACVQAPVNFNYTTVTIIPEVSGSYIIRSNINQSSFITLHSSNFNPANACTSFIASNAAFLGSTYNLSTPISVDLIACTEYVVVLSTFASLPATSTLTEISGPGRIIEKNATPDPLYTTSFIAVNVETNVVASVNVLPDFRNLAGGFYTVYSISHLVALPSGSLINRPLSEILSTECVYLSSNFRELEIKSSCRFIAAEVGIQTACDPVDNTYNQRVTLRYEQPPVSGFLSVYGQNFEITGSPQTVVLSDLTADGLATEITAYFTEMPGCRLEEKHFFSAPENCCPFEINLGLEMNLCPGSSITLDAGSGGVNFEWFRNQSPLNQNVRMLNAQTPGTYTVKVTNFTGCSKYDTVIVNAQSAPQVFLPEELIICDSENYFLESAVASSLPVSILWYKDGILLQNENAVGLEVNQAGLYRIDVVNAAGCQSSDSTNIIFTSTPVVDLGPDINVCEGSDISLSGGNAGDSYQWFFEGVPITGATEQVYHPTMSGLYSLEVTNNNFCKANDAVIVRFFESPIIQPLGTEINKCSGDSLLLQATAEAYSSLQWYFEGNAINGANAPDIKIFNTGLYTLEATNLAGCKSNSSVNVFFRNLPTANLGSDITACTGSFLIIGSPYPEVQYSWAINGQLLNFSDASLTVTQSGIYSVTLTSAYGCSASDEVMVTFVAGPDLDIGTDQEICQGDIYLLRAVSNANSIKWLKDGELIPLQNEFAIIVTQTGNYEAIVRGGMPECEVRKSVQITVNPRPNVFLGDDRVLCTGDIISLTAGADFSSYLWTLNGTEINTSQSISVQSGGNYGVIVKNAFNCEGSDEINITESMLPSLEMESQYDICTANIIVLQPVTNGTIFELYLENILLATQTSPRFEIDKGGAYEIIAINASGCASLKSFSVTERPVPFVSLGRDTVLCPNELISLNAGIHQSVKWSDGTSGADLIINSGTPSTLSSGMIWVEVANEFDCKSADTVIVTLLPVINGIISASSPGICNGDPVVLIATGGKYYEWSGPPGTVLNPSASAIEVNPVETSVFTVQISDDCPQNTINKSFEVKVFDSRDISAGNDTCVISGRTIRLAASGGIRYEWDNKSLIDGSSNVSNPVVRPEVETLFTVTITDANGCVYEASVLVCVIEDPFSKFKAVSIITPNGDGFNDELYFDGLEFFSDSKLMIYNRWGNIVFEANGYQYRSDRLFDGTRNGERLPADTYYYVLTVEGNTYKSALTILWD